jgi:hypothetical protein
MNSEPKSKRKDSSSKTLRRARKFNPNRLALEGVEVVLKSTST